MIEQAFTKEEQAQALATGQEAAQQVELPEERYAGLGAWAARGIIKSAKTPMSVGISRKDLYKKYNIPEPSKHNVETKTPKSEDVETTQIDRPLDGNVALKPREEIDLEMEAIGISKSDLSQYDLTEDFQMNISTLESEDSVKAVIAQQAEHNKAYITEARRGVVRDEQLRKLAEDLGQDKEFLEEVLSRKTGETFNAEKLLAARQVLEVSATQLKKLADKVSSKTANDQEKLMFHKQLAFHQEFQAQFMGARAETGRALRALGVPSGTLESNTDKITELLTMANRGVDIDKIANSIVAADDSKAVNRLVDTFARSKTNVVFDALYEVYINSILSGFKTHLVNLMGSKLRLWVDMVDTAVAARMGGGDALPEDKIAAGEWKAAFFAQNLVARESLEMGWRTMKTGEAYQGMSKMESTERRTIDSEVFAKTFGLDPDGLFAGVVDFIGNTLRAPTERLMGGTDALMRHQAERVHIVKAAYREANYLSEAQNLTPEESLKLLQDLIDNPTEKIRQEATDFASEVTFQSPLSTNMQGLQRFVHTFPGARYIMPFIKTPTNLLKQGFLDRTVAGMWTKRYREEIAAGGARAQMARSKMLTGNLLATGIYFMAMDGKVTGSMPQDPDIARARMEGGWRPRSFVFENAYGEKVYVSYDRMEPISYIIGAVADFHEMQEYTKYSKLGEEEEDSIWRAAGSITMAISENTLNKTFMTNLRDSMQIATDGNPKKMERWIGQQLNAMIPFSGARRDITRLMDETKRVSDDVTTMIQANMPGGSKELPPRLDNFGNEMKFDTVLSPWPVVTEDSSWMTTEINRLAYNTRRAPIPRMDNKIKGVKMTAQEYHDILKLSRKHLVIKGKNFKETVETTMTTPEFDLLTDDMKIDLLRSIAIRFDSAARNMAANENPSLMEKMQRKSFIKPAQLQAKKNGTDPEDELENLKDLYLKGD